MPVIGMSGDESLDQSRLTGTGLSGKGDDPPPARARLREGIAQASQLIFALQQFDRHPLGW